jgi:hypothetical protein
MVHASLISPPQPNQRNKRPSKRAMRLGITEHRPAEQRIPGRERTSVVAALGMPVADKPAFAGRASSRQVPGRRDPELELTLRHTEITDMPGNPMASLVHRTRAVAEPPCPALNRVKLVVDPSQRDVCVVEKSIEQGAVEQRAVER